MAALTLRLRPTRIAAVTGETSRPRQFCARTCHSGKAGARRGPPQCKYAAKIDAVGSPRDERSEEAPTRKERQGRSAKIPACRRAQGKFIETQGERQAEGATKGSE